MKAKNDERKFRLTVFLIKESYQNIGDFLNAGGLKTASVKKDEKIVGTLIYKGGFKSKPAWVSIFDSVPGFDSSAIFNQSSKAIYVTRHKGRWFCFTFGYARHLIDELAYERNFGLVVTLNLSDPAAIKSIDKINIGHVSLHSKEQATKEIELAGFEFNNEIDLLKSVTGKSKTDSDEEEQDVLSGRDSVSIYTKATIDSFSEIAERLFNAYSSKKYKERYPWLDHVREERDIEKIGKLDERLASQIASKDFSKIWLAVPELIDWKDIKGFAYKYKEDSPDESGPVLYQDLELEQWLKSTNVKKDLTASQLRNKKLHVYWQDRPPTHWSVYRCLNAEIDLANHKYILNDGDWYNIDSDYVKEVNDFYQSVPDSKLKLPGYGSDTEPSYLGKAASSGDYALMDRKEIMIGGGRSRVEFCDLYSKKNEIIHVKRYGGSSLLSHLFNQALVSGECFLYDEGFRSKLNALLPGAFKLPNTKDKPIANTYEVCMAIMSKEPGPLELPFFSKVSLKHTVRALRNLEYKVTKLKIAS